MIKQIKNKTIIINDELVKTAQRRFIEITDRYCEDTLKAMLTPDLDSIGKIDYEKEFSVRTGRELSRLLTKAIIEDIEMNGGFYDE